MHVEDHHDDVGTLAASDGLQAVLGVPDLAGDPGEFLAEEDLGELTGVGVVVDDQHTPRLIHSNIVGAVEAS